MISYQVNVRVVNDDFSFVLKRISSHSFLYKSSLVFVQCAYLTDFLTFINVLAQVTNRSKMVVKRRKSAVF